MFSTWNVFTQMNNYWYGYVSLMSEGFSNLKEGLFR